MYEADIGDVATMPKTIMGLSISGPQSDGSFNTAQAKIYQVGMNEVIGRAMFPFAVQFSDSAG